MSSAQKRIKISILIELIKGVDYGVRVDALSHLAHNLRFRLAYCAFKGYKLTVYIAGGNTIPVYKGQFAYAGPDERLC